MNHIERKQAEIVDLSLLAFCLRYYELPLTPEDITKMIKRSVKAIQIRRVRLK